MKDVVEMLAHSLRERNVLWFVVGMILFPITSMFRFKDAILEANYPDRNRPLHGELWIGNLHMQRNLHELKMVAHRFDGRDSYPTTV
jgi:hypothetical protein